MSDDGNTSRSGGLTPWQLKAMLERSREPLIDDAAFAGTANRRFLRLSPDIGLRWPGVDWAGSLRPGFDWPMLGLGQGWKGTPVFGGPSPRFRTRSRKPANKLADLCDFASTDWLLASARAAKALARLQPDGVEVLPVELEMHDSTVRPAGEFCMLDVTRMLPAFDIKASGLEIDEDEYGRRYLPRDYQRVILREDLPPDARLFRDEVDRQIIWISVEGREVLHQAGITGVVYAWPDRGPFFRRYC